MHRNSTADVSEHPSRLQLPACQKCRLRKVRCDRQAPKCTNCTRGSFACIVVDPETGEQYARDYIRQLEEEEARLKTQLGENTAATYPPPTPPSDDAERAQQGPLTGSSMASQSHFVGDGSGLGFLYSILSDAKWQQHRARITSQLAARPRIEKQQLTPNPLPPVQEAERLLENYFSRFHIHHTFLLRQEVLAIFGRIYSPSQTGDAQPSAQDRFRLLMVFAISATTRHRAGLSSENPYGYFMAAEAYLGSIPLIKDIEAIQNLLLIARFAMYHHIGTSLWEISQLCMRQCIEWRLHVNSLEALDPITEQHRRRIFWECYVLDRYSSGILGRPFAIMETEISVQLPIDVDDETLIASAVTSLNLVLPNIRSGLTELSVFIHCIKLRQISSRIHTDFYTGRGLESHSGDGGSITSPSRYRSIGHVYTSFSRFHAELQVWRSTCPVFPDPRSLYERPEWHDFLYEKDLMLLARGAVHNVPSRSYSVGGVTKEIFVSCYESASRVIELYDDLMSKRAITWTRSYFQVIFTAGLTVIYCISLEVLKNTSDGRDPLRTLSLCNDILSFFKEKMPDAGSFAVVFDLLKIECIGHRSNTGAYARHTGASMVHGLLDQNSSTMASDVTGVDFASYTAPTNIDTMAFEAYNSMQPSNVDFNVGLADDLDLMTQLEAELGEYAWGWIPMENDFFGQGLFH